MVRTLYTLAITLLLANTIISQNKVLDSLKRELKAAKDDTTRCQILNSMIENELIDSIWIGFNENLKKICEINLSQSNSNTKTKNIFLYYYARALNNHGFYNTIKGNKKNAIEFYMNSLK